MLQFAVSPGLHGFRGVENRRLEKIRVPEPGGCENMKYCQTILKKASTLLTPRRPRWPPLVRHGGEGGPVRLLQLPQAPGAGLRQRRKNIRQPGIT